MPIYEYRCHDCRRRVSVFVRSISSVGEVRCPHCGGQRLERLFSRVVVRRGAARRDRDDAAGGWDGADLEADFNGDDAAADGEDSFDVPGLDPDADPREIARWTREMSASLGEPLDPELDRALTDIERGADPDEVLEQLDESGPPDPPAVEEG